MIQAKCVQKFRNSSGQIIGYRLIDFNGVTQDVKAENLKEAIRSGKINIVNLTLTKDNRLLDIKEQKLQSKSLGKPPYEIGAVKVGNDTGNYGYWRYLDKSMFGTTSNTSSAVGRKIDGYDRKNHKEYNGYSYVLHAGFNILPPKPGAALCALFRDKDKDTVEVKVLLGREGYIGKRSIAIVGYVKDFGYLTLKKSDTPEIWSKTLAEAFNVTAKEVFKLLEQNHELGLLLKLGEPLKQY